MIVRQLSQALLALSFAALTACSGPSQHGTQRQVAEAEEPAPQPAVQSPEEQKETDAAKQSYLACLNRAARFADDHVQAAANVATLIAPMCYPQFERYEMASQAGLSRRDTRLQVRHGDQQQVELASEAVRQERSQAASASVK